MIANDDFLDIRSYARDIETGVLTPLYALEPAYDVRPGRPWREGLSTPLHVADLSLAKEEEEQLTFVRIFNRTDHPVRILLTINRIRFSFPFVRCDLPPAATLTQAAADLWEAALEEDLAWADGVQLEGLNLEVRVLTEPLGPVPVLSCSAPDEGAAPLEAGRVTDIGMMTLTKDAEGRLTNLSSPISAQKIGSAHPPRPSPAGWRGFDVTLEFGEEFNEEWRDAITHAVKRVEQIITVNYPDSYADLSGCGITGRRRRVDELLIRFEALVDVPSYIGGSAHVCSSVPEPGFPGGRPNAGLIRLNIAAAGPDPEQVYDFLALDRVILHETLHILGIGGFWRRSGYLRLDVARPEFTGPQATAAFARLYPRRAVAARQRGVHGVPVEDDGAHWRSSAYAVDGIDATYTVPDDIMTPGGNRAQHNLLTEITLGALEDLGYTVDYSQAAE